MNIAIKCNTEKSRHKEIYPMIAYICFKSRQI